MRLLFTLSILLLVGCTITKRHFGPGYHVEWKKAYSGSEGESEKSDFNHLEEEHPAVLDVKVVSKQTALIDSVYINKAVFLDDLKIPIEAQQPIVSEVQNELNQNLRIQPGQISDDDVPIDQPKRKIDPFTLAALGSLLLGLLLLLTIGIADMTLSILTGIGLLMVLFSIISVIRIIRHPELYKAKGLTWTLFGISMTVSGLALLLLIFYLLVITNNVDLF